LTAAKQPIVEVVIRDLAFDGKAVGDIDGKVIFLDAGLPGEKVKARIVRKKARYDIGKVLEIIEKSDERVKAPCQHFDICGGCTWQDLDYSKQLYYKRKQIVDCLRHIGRIDDITVAETLGALSQFHYRNKMEFSFNVDREEGFVLGLHHRGEYDRIFNLKECLLQSDTANRIVCWVRDYVRNENLSVYDISRHTGLLRFLMIREGITTKQVMVNIVTTGDEFSDQADFIEKLTAEFLKVTTVVRNINDRKANIAKGDREIILYGDGYIEEELLGNRFRIYANSFFQTNSVQAGKLFQTAFDLLGLEKADCLLDLYCGTGAIGLSAARYVGNVVGIELEPSAVQAASENAAVNNIENTVFYVGSVQELMKTQPEIFDSITCTIVDPPRAGMHKKALAGLIDTGCHRLVYISCNPASFARDATILLEKGYRPGKVIPVDMFPHTMHIELVADFRKEAS
jgi:23S rRNA (uracil1939-C5)-methyltransferase